jgi:hypothetical protein
MGVGAGTLMSSGFPSRVAGDNFNPLAHPFDQDQSVPGLL